MTCACTQNNIGILLSSTTDTHVYDCACAASTDAGYSLSSSSRIVFKACKALLTGVGSSTNSHGFISDNGSRNIFDKCLVEGTTTTATGENNVAAGFTFKGTEVCSEIITCSVSSSSVSASDPCYAYGIQFEPTFSSFGTALSGNRGANTNAAAWLSNGICIAIAGDAVSGNELQFYIFNYYDNTLTLQDAASHGATINSVAFTEDRQFLAIGGATGTGSNEVRIYEVDEVRHGLTLRDSVAHGAAIKGVAWSPNGRYLAIVGVASATYELRVYEIDRENKTLTLLDSVAHGATLESIAWSKDNTFLAVGGAAVTSNEVHVYELDYGTKTLTLRESKAHGATVYSIAWSFDQQFLAVGGAVGTGSNDIRCYEFDTSAKTLTLRDSVAHGATVNGVTWSPDGKYLGIGGVVATGNEVRSYSFSYATKTFTLVDSFAHGGTINTMCWSPCGQFALAVGDTATSLTHHILPTLVFPVRCIVCRNIIYNITGGNHGRSAGLSIPGSSNFLMTNLCYDNDINYSFVTNVFSGGLNGTAGTLQNISL